MREILFRGQTRKYGEKVRMGDGQKLPGHWVYGGVLQGVGCHSIIYGGENVNDPGENLDKWCVHTDTLGQFTGLTDKNGKRIFEGDIAKYTNKDGTTAFYEVVWDNELFAPMFQLIGSCSGVFVAGMNELVEVIGNIHDNPELLENP